MNTLNFGAIDIGSNAARLLIASVNAEEPSPQLRKAILLRIPIRLGEDVFATGKISEDRAKKFIRMMKAFNHLLKIYNVESVRAYATSAMRDAENGKQLAEEIRKKTDIEIEIIDGKKEAAIIYESHIADLLNSNHRYIYVDVGGGSTELTLIENKKMVKSRSFNIGTLRTLAGKVKPSEWEEMSTWLAGVVDSGKQIEIIGAGGNINKLYRLAKLSSGHKLSKQKLGEIYDELNKLTVDERMIQYGMRADRADVIIPAAEIFLRVADLSKADKINVPTIGLADGMVHMLYEEYKQKK